MLMFSEPLIEGILIKRYKRFFADVRISSGADSGKVVVSHCPNTGSMASCGEPNSVVYLSYNNDLKRKLRYTWQYTKVVGGFININTLTANKIVLDGLNQKLIPELASYDQIKPEAKYGGSRIDFLLSSNNQPQCFVEIKNTTMLVGDRLMFPDAPTTRGQKHLQELMKIKADGNRAVLIFLANRPCGQCFEIADSIDPIYGQLALQAIDAGVEIYCYRAHNTLEGSEISVKVPWYKR